MYNKAKNKYVPNIMTLRRHWLEKVILIYNKNENVKRIEEVSKVVLELNFNQYTCYS